MVSFLYDVVIHFLFRKIWNRFSAFAELNHKLNQDDFVNRWG